MQTQDSSWQHHRLYIMGSFTKQVCNQMNGRILMAVSVNEQIYKG